MLRLPMNKKILIIGSAAFGTLMFILMLWDTRDNQQPWVYPLLLLLSVASSVLMYAGMRLIFTLLVWYAGKGAMRAVTSKKGLRLANILTSGLTLAPLWYGAFCLPEVYLWPMLAAIFGPILTMLPLASASWKIPALAWRFSLGIILGAGMGFSLLLLQDQSTLEAWRIGAAWCFFFAFCGGIAQAAGLFSHRFFTRAP